MKKVLFILLAVVSLSCFSQTDETVTIPQDELNEFFLAIDTLTTQDSIKTLLIRDLEFQIINYKTLVNQDSTLLLYRSQEIELLNNQIILYDNRLKVVDKWYNKRWVGTVIGIAGTIGIIHAINYSLPQ
jgi:hypothetical protein